MNSDDIVKTLEAASYVATIGVFVVAVIALFQISVTKKIARNSAKRDSLASANSQIAVFLDSVIAKSNKLFLEVRTKKITVFEESTVDIVDNEIVVKFGPNKKKAINDLMSLDSLLEYLNALESFATYFTSELADEKLAFKSVGNTYCSSVKTYMPAIKTLGSNKYFKNLIELYIMWQERINIEQLEFDKDTIEKKIKSMNKKSITPIGTNETE